MDKNTSYLPLSPSTEVQILIYRGDIRYKYLDPKKRRPMELPQIDNAKAQAILDKIPSNRRISVKFNLEDFLQTFQLTKLWITPWTNLPSGRASKYPFTIRGRPINGITATPCFMFLNIMIWAKGIFNKPGYHCGNCFDFATPEGMALFLHEMYHIYQFFRNPLKMLKNYIQAVHDSIVYAHILFSHRHIPFEIEAIAFENELFSKLKRVIWIKRLQFFARYR
jgi:hypothetical protein